jgi:K+-transporting ATPase KdpF subunit
MAAIYLVITLIIMALFVYLVVALLKPEIFS